MDIGKSIKFVRVAANLKQGEMAKELEISQNYLSLLENNKTEPSLSLLKKISEKFNVPISFLLLEGTLDYKSDKPEVDAVLKSFQELVHQLQKNRVAESNASK